MNVKLNYTMFTEKEYFGDCEHPWSNGIEDKSCLKRYFKINDFNKDKSYTLIVCNEYIKLKMKEWSANTQFNPYIRNEAEYKYQEIIESIIREKTEINTGLGGLMAKRNNINPKVTFYVCKRPYIYYTVSFYEWLKKLATTKNRVIYTELYYKLESAFYQITDYMIRYVKYKSDHQKIKSLRNNFSEISDNTPKSIDMISEIIKLLNKYNIKN